jgi:hypothetical protein
MRRFGEQRRIRRAAACCRHGLEFPFHYIHSFNCLELQLRKHCYFNMNLGMLGIIRNILLVFCWISYGTRKSLDENVTR